MRSEDALQVDDTMTVPVPSSPSPVCRAVLTVLFFFADCRAKEFFLFSLGAPQQHG